MLAGAGDILVGALLAPESAERRDRWARKASAFGFRTGIGLYLLALVNQLTFRI